MRGRVYDRSRCGTLSTMYEEITYEVEDPVATLTLNRPEQMNALTARMADELRDAVRRAEGDRSVVGIVLTGAGRGFSSGGDLGRLAKLRDEAPDQGAAVAVDPRAGAREGSLGSASDDFTGEYTYLMATEKPIVAAINGAIAGMAIPIALCCDIRFMAAEAKMLPSFSQLGLIAEWGISWLLPRLVGPAVALDILMTSRPLSGTEAAELGIVHAAVPAEEVVARSRDYVRALAERTSPRSLAIIKRQVYEQAHAGLGAAEQEARALMLASFRHSEFREGLGAFMEKRPPRFDRLPPAQD
ncbi:MAG: enoyl-CoA hydratase-related protein [Acidimicrobiia bacterium]